MYIYILRSLLISPSSAYKNHCQIIQVFISIIFFPSIIEFYHDFCHCWCLNHKKSPMFTVKSPHNSVSVRNASPLPPAPYEACGRPVKGGVTKMGIELVIDLFLVQSPSEDFSSIPSVPILASQWDPSEPGFHGATPRAPTSSPDQLGPRGPLGAQGGQDLWWLWWITKGVMGTIKKF